MRERLEASPMFSLLLLTLALQQAVWPRLFQEDSSSLPCFNGHPQELQKATVTAYKYPLCPGLHKRVSYHLNSNLWLKFLPPFIQEESEAQRSQVTGPRSTANSRTGIGNQICWISKALLFLPSVYFCTCCSVPSLLEVNSAPFSISFPLQPCTEHCASQ